MKKIITTALLILMFCLDFLRAQPISTNIGTIPNSELRYSVSLEFEKNKWLNLKFVITNDSKQSCNLNLSSFSIPGDTALFFSTDNSRLDSSNKDWLSEYIIPSNHGGLGTKYLAPGTSAVIQIPLGDVYGRIYEKMKGNNVYVYWGVTVSLANDSAQQARVEKRRMVPINYTSLPRIGGMLTLPKGTKLDEGKPNNPKEAE